MSSPTPSGINPATIDAKELFDLLESPQQFVVDDIKSLIQENVNTTKDSWLVAGLYDYYIQTNSTPCMEILLSLSKEPHDKFLIEKIIEGLRSPQQQTPARKLSVIFLGHLVRKQPSWLYKIVNCGLVKELIKLMKVETDIIIIMTGLLVLTTILPMLPTYLIPFVNDIFDVFGRLAAWTQSAQVQLLEEHILHILVGLYSLFHRLYAMFPCNFLSFLRHNFSPADKRHIFIKTIKPMLETVKMHPLLVIATKEGELSPNRWKNKEYHDIIAEYAEISLDVLESGSSEEFTPLNLRPRLSTGGPVVEFPIDRAATTQAVQKLPMSPLIQQAMKLDQNELTSLGAHIDEAAPPTPMSAISHSHASASAVLSPAPPSITTTPAMGKNVTASPPEAGVEATPENTPISTPIKERERSHTHTHFKLPPPGSPAVAQLTFGKATATPHTPPSTPFNSVPSSPAPHTAGAGGEGPPTFVLGPAAAGVNLNRRDSIFDSMRRDNSIMYQRLQKVMNEQQQQKSDETSMPPPPISSGVGVRPSPLTLGDAVITLEPLPGSDSLVLGTDGPLTPYLGSHVEESADEHDELTALQSVPGVPMPDTRSMIAFAKRVSRLRYYSHCGEQATGSTGGPSPGTSPSSSSIVYMKTKRSVSCPDVRKKSVLEMEESGGAGGGDSMDGSSISTAGGGAGLHLQIQEEDEITPTLETFEPYEHLFDGVLPQFLRHPENKKSIQSPHYLLDLCLNKAASLHAPKRGDELSVLTGQVELLHCQLLFERHRRESHALRNRNLAKKCRNIQQKEEQNCALRSQLHSLEKEVAILKKDIMVQRTMTVNKEQQLQAIIKDLETKLQQQKAENQLQLEKMSNLEKKHEKMIQEHQALLKESDQRKADIFQLESEVKHCKKYVDVNNELKAAFEASQKEILLLGELARRQQEVIANHEPHRYLLHEMEDLRLTCEDEIRSLKNILETKSSQTEAALGFIQNLESQIAKKDAILAEQKKLLQDSSAVYEIQLKALEDKYNSVKKCNQRLEFEILNLNHQLTLKNLTMRSSSSQRRISPNGESPHNSNASDVDSAASAGGLQLSPERSMLIFGSLQFDSPSGELNDLQRVIECEGTTTSTAAAGRNEGHVTSAAVGASRHLPPRQQSSQRHEEL